MQKKIVFGIVLIALMIFLLNPYNVKAEICDTEKYNYTNVQDFMDSIGFEGFVQKQGYNYVVVKKVNCIVVYEFYIYEDKEPYIYLAEYNENTNYIVCAFYNSGGFTSNEIVFNDIITYPDKSKTQTSSSFMSGKWVKWNGTSSYSSYGFISKDSVFLYSDLDIYYCDSVSTITGDKTNIKIHKSIGIKEPEILENGLCNITENGFYYNNVYYEWNSSQKAYMILENLTDYLVFYDDYNKQLIFVWAFDDFMAQAKNQKSGLRFYSYYYEFITETNNSSVLPYCYSIYQINADGTLECINSLQNEKAEDNHQFSFGWTNPIYEPQLDNIDNFSTYEEYVLNNNLIASNCDIYNNSGVLVKSAVTLNNDLITPDEVPETEIGSIKYYLYEKLPIIRTVEVFVKKFNVVLESMKESGEPPEIIMNFDNYYGFGGEVNVLDVSWYEDYREPVKAILSAILIIPFILWVYKKGLPEAIGGI